MNGTFNGQILIEKLAKLNNSQQSIETLSHWCIFHRKKAKQVVETWDQQFHCSPREQRVSFLYLANDILQNSRRKGSEFVAEFWKVLPNALRDVIVNGDEFGRNAALRLVDIWEERKVFGSRGQILKEELVGMNLESNSKNGIGSGFKLKKSVGDTLEKIISSYEVVYDGPVDEEALLSKCRTAISSVEKVEKEIGGNHSSVQLSGPAFVEELQSQRSILGDCIEQLNAAESSRETLVSHLRDALQEQEFKLAQVRNELQAAQARSEQVDNICEQLTTSNNGQPLLTEQRLKEANTFPVPETPVMGGDKGQPFPITSTHIEEDTRKSAAAAVAAKLAASTSSAQMLSYVLSSLASEGVIGNPLSESSNDYRSEKRPKLENGPSSYLPFHHPQPPPPPPPPPPPFPHPDSVQLSSYQPPPPPSSSPISRPSQPPPLPPMPPPHSLHFMQTAGSMSSVPYSYGMSQQRPPPLPGYPMDGGGMPPIPSPPPPYQNFQGSEGGFFSQPPLPATPPISRQ